MVRTMGVWNHRPSAAEAVAATEATPNREKKTKARLVDRGGNRTYERTGDERTSYAMASVPARRSAAALVSTKTIA